MLDGFRPGWLLIVSASSVASLASANRAVELQRGYGNVDEKKEEGECEGGRRRRGAERRRDIS